MAIGSLLLVAGSWRLWTPQSLFPRIPLFSVALRWSEPVDQWLTWVCLGCWLLITAVLAIPKLPMNTARTAALLYALLFGLLVILDQHRLQPWGVHIAVCLLILTAFETQRMINWLVAFNASIYIYSALSKLDAQFLHTVGQDFLGGLLRVWPGALERLSQSARFWLAALFPIGELLCGLGLLWRPSRKVAWGMAIVMHATLIAILSPWGLSHSWGVLLWNALFIGLNILTWRTVNQMARGKSSEAQPPATQASRTDGWSLRCWRIGVTALCTAMLALPLGERLGLVDHWLGWALYAPHSSRARLELLSGAVERQTPVVQRYVQIDPVALNAWDYVAVERWSLQELGVPIYPQQRFYVGVALALARSNGQSLRVTLLDAADRWSGARKQRVLENEGELNRASTNYWFNTQPRWLGK